MLTIIRACWKNGADRLVQHRFATNLQLVKNAISVNCNKIGMPVLENRPQPQDKQKLGCMPFSFPQMSFHVALGPGWDVFVGMVRDGGLAHCLLLGEWDP